ncbi:MAG: ABC-F family ATP-binding cassette domain-containing protein [Bacteroidetes bacterium]|nr:ABC-F family ATP-binding cassette domain-containing protein [Bacteroidota bacterium]MBL6943906.1 ABC-F family ATP-binding cassette domain-containing protein [Bacteroidales bacterium]
MNYLSAENISKSYGEKILFTNISFGLNKGDKAALVANNASGKSTLLRILTGEDLGDTGTVTIRSGIKISMLPQDPFFENGLTVDEIIKNADSELVEMVMDYETAIHQNSDKFSNETQKALELATAQMDINEAWDFERRLKLLLEKFNIDLNQKVETMSGGQVKRLSLALTLLDDPDVLLLDEPTNHLDIEMIEWLEKYLQSSSVTLLMVTHDRYFLDRICNRIVEITDGELYHHKGNYSYFLEKKSQREEVTRVDVDKARRLMKKELEWMRRSPKARTTKSKARIDSFYNIQDKATSIKPSEELKLGVHMSRVGNKILEMENVSKTYGEIVILDGFDYIFKKGERIGFVGKNGVGKSSFLNLIMQEEKPDSGKIISGETIVYGHYKQEGIKIKETQTVLEVVKDIAEIIPTGKGSSLTASQFLQHFMFPPKVQNDYVSKLSGGERRRLYLLTVLVKNPNFLILDEPTNDLDLLTLNKLEEFLEGFKGCLILVSHDRYFLDKLVDHLFVFEGEGRIKDYHSNYTEYKLMVEDKDRQLKSELVSEKKENKKNIKRSAEKKKLSYKEKLEYESLIIDIEALENEKESIEKIIGSGETAYEELEKLSVRIGEIIDSIDQKTLRWMELDEFVS